MRLLDHYPLDVCSRVAEHLKRKGWKLNHFECKVEVFESFRWYAKVHIKTELTTKPPEQKWAELQAAFHELELKVEKVASAMNTQETGVVQHRKYDYDRVVGRRMLRGHWYDFHVEFKPARDIQLSVLTEEEV